MLAIITEGYSCSARAVSKRSISQDEFAIWKSDFMYRTPKFTHRICKTDPRQDQPCDPYSQSLQVKNLNNTSSWNVMRVLYLLSHLDSWACSHTIGDNALRDCFDLIGWLENSMRQADFLSTWMGNVLYLSHTPLQSQDYGYLRMVILMQFIGPTFTSDPRALMPVIM
jgi:hypothetical protein